MDLLFQPKLMVTVCPFQKMWWCKLLLLPSRARTHLWVYSASIYISVCHQKWYALSFVCVPAPVSAIVLVAHFTVYKLTKMCPNLIKTKSTMGVICKRTSLVIFKGTSFVGCKGTASVCRKVHSLHRTYFAKGHSL